MTLQALDDQITLWTDHTRPARMVWRGERWRVSDTPTALRDEVLHPAITHPLERTVGWRFQATNETGSSYVFDIRRHGAGWQLTAVYD